LNTLNRKTVFGLPPASKLQHAFIRNGRDARATLCPIPKISPINDSLEREIVKSKFAQLYVNPIVEFPRLPGQPPDGVTTQRRRGAVPLSGRSTF
jgi:hypothetical protein